MLAKSELLEFLSQLPEEALAACLILSIIFTFITVIVTIHSIADAHKSITLARMSKQMIDDLLARGYSPEEIEPLVNGKKGWMKLGKIFGMAKSYFPDGRKGREPVPPVKQGWSEHTAV